MTQHWRPTASLKNIKERARILNGIRAFFAQKNVLEVNTPVISPAAITDPQIESFSTQFNQHTCFLHTSPEFYMKRLLAAGSGDIFQIANVFRDDELGRHHNPEFTLLEWYRINFDHHQLMDEVQSLLSELVPAEKKQFQRISYQQAFIKQLQIDPFNVDVDVLKKCAEKNKIETPQGMGEDKDMWLDWLMVEKIAPSFSKNGFTFLYDYPASQASLARLDKTDSRKANRFELFFGELELANGFYELTDAQEQLQRFQKENEIREQRKQKVMPIDMDLIDALAVGLPNCSGVAMGIDRVLMLALGAEHIRDVICFAEEFF